MTRLARVAVDARMIAHSGIGTALRGLLRAWADVPPPFAITLMGDPSKLGLHVPAGLEAEVVEWRAPIYSAGSLVARAPIGRADVVLGMHYTAPVLPRRPLVAVVHDVIHITHPTRAGTSAFARAMLAVLRRRAAYVVTPSRHTKVQLQTLHGFDAHRVLTIPWGPGLSNLEPKPIDDPRLAPTGYLLAVGILKPHKNWPFMLEHLAGLWRTGQLALPLVASGLGDQSGQKLREMARSLGIADDRVIVLSRLEDAQMSTLFGGASALLFPSLIEGFGFPILEAMRAGTPVVAADLPPMNEVGGDALVPFDLDAPESFDQAVCKIVNEDAYRRERIARGLALAARFDWRTTARRFEGVLARAADAEF